jgi:CheY-like chemotaxis protein
MEIEAFLMDIQMPNVDGIEATRQIRGEGGARRPWIVGVTASPLDAIRHACFDAGMDDFVGKPLTHDVLTRILDRSRRSYEAEVDMARLDALRSTSAALGRDVLARLVSLYLRDAPARMADQRKALADGDLVALRRLAHSLKGMSASLGLLALTSMCEELERCGDDLVAIEALLSACELELSRARAFLTSEVERLR